MSENINSNSNHQHHHHHHHHRSKHRLSRNKKLLKKIIWPIAIIFLFIIFITFFPDLVNQVFHRENVEDGITVPKTDKFGDEPLVQYDQQKTIHWNEWSMMA